MIDNGNELLGTLKVIKPMKASQYACFQQSTTSLKLTKKSIDGEKKEGFQFIQVV